jgi:hypothetical protein
MANKQGRSDKLPRNRKKTLGMTLIIIGMSGFVLCLLWFFCGSRTSDFEIYIGTYIVLLLTVVFFLISTTGGILFWGGDNEDRRQSKLNKAIDSQSK